jgi:hypothetical protein
VASSQIYSDIMFSVLSDWIPIGFVIGFNFCGSKKEKHNFKHVISVYFQSNFERKLGL